MCTKKYLEIVEHLESCLDKHGDTPQGVDWPNYEDTLVRHRVMLELIRPWPPEDVSLLDFGCGLSHFYEYLLDQGITGIGYSGADISEKFIRYSRHKYPNNTYFCMDLLDSDTDLPSFDYIILNGVFTEKVTLSFKEMFDYFQRLITHVFRHARVGIAFNVMSKLVEWERDDLFHLPLDDLTQFLAQSLSRSFIIRNDYGLYEYTVYLYRKEARTW
jgi:hypothetical protein